MIIEKVVLKIGKKKIELTQSEYDELKQHFSDKEYIPYPYPIYPNPYRYPDTSPWYVTTTTTPVDNNFDYMPMNNTGVILNG